MEEEKTRCLCSLKPPTHSPTHPLYPQDGRPSRKTKTVTVDVPPGVETGVNIRMAGQGGEGGKGAPPGNPPTHPPTHSLWMWRQASTFEWQDKEEKEEKAPLQVSREEEVEEKLP